MGTAACKSFMTSDVYLSQGSNDEKARERSAARSSTHDPACLLRSDTTRRDHVDSRKIPADCNLNDKRGRSSQQRDASGSRSRCWQWVRATGKRNALDGLAQENLVHNIRWETVASES